MGLQKNESNPKITITIDTGKEEKTIISTEATSTSNYLKGQIVVVDLDKKSIIVSTHDIKPIYEIDIGFNVLGLSNYIKNIPSSDDTSPLDSKIYNTKKTTRSTPCPYCNRKVNNLMHHVSANHPNEWPQYSELDDVKKNLISRNISRCTKCGTLVKNLKKHIKKVHNHDTHLKNNS